MPDPVRAAPDIVIHAGMPLALHEQPAVAVTVKLPLIAEAPTFWLVGVTV